MDAAKAFVSSISDQEVRAEVFKFLCQDTVDYLSALAEVEKKAIRMKCLDGECLKTVTELDDQIVKSGEKLCCSIEDKVLVKNIRRAFRDLCGEKSFFRSEIVKKGFVKPRGYPGDFEMMNYVYDNVIVSKDPLGQYFERDFLNKAYAQAVRGRKDKMVELLRQFIKLWPGQKLRILNLPCGPARDIKDLLMSGEVREDVQLEIVCVDQDEAALKFAAASISQVPDNVVLTFQKGDILNFVRRQEQHLKELGEFDFVYSIGLADYLTDKLLASMISFCWRLVRFGGSVTYAFKIEDKDPFAPIPPKWFCDWVFVPRTLTQAKDLLEEALNSADVYRMREAEWERSGHIAFLTADKV